jgi:DNA-binding transcriptional LysR family regulator
MSDIETRLLRYFVAVAEERHFASASERLGITPPTLTQQIQKLESQLGTKLLRRKGNTKIVITAAGQRVLDHARDVLRRIDEVAPIAQQAERGELGRLEVGFVMSVYYAGLLESWIGPFRQAHPAIHLATRKLASTAQIAGILHHELDAGFARAPLKYPPGLRGFEIRREPLVLAVPREHPLARHKAISPAMLAGEAFVTITSSEPHPGFFGYTEAIGRMGNFEPHVVERENDFISVLAHVARSRGIAVVPELMKKTMSDPNVVFRDIAADPVPQRSIALVYGSRPSPATNSLIRYMQRHALRKPSGGDAPPNGSAGPKDSPKSTLRRAA